LLSNLPSILLELRVNRHRLTLPYLTRYRKNISVSIIVLWGAFKGYFYSSSDQSSHD
jgi:hypothetical protein